MPKNVKLLANMNLLVKLLALVIVLPVFLSGLVACGNKGDLYQKADPDVELELEEAAEKLKKKQN